MGEKIGYFIAGQGILGLVTGIMPLIACLLIGLLNALALVLTEGFPETVLMIGPLPVAIHATIIALRKRGIFLVDDIDVKSSESQHKTQAWK